VSSFITAAFLVFGLILARTILRLWVERRREQLGARFKTKMVVGAMALSLLPIIFMFIVSYSLINRSLLLWFSEAARDRLRRNAETSERSGTGATASASRAGFAGTSRGKPSRGGILATLIRKGRGCSLGSGPQWQGDTGGYRL